MLVLYIGEWLNALIHVARAFPGLVEGSTTLEDEFCDKTSIGHV